MSFKLYDFDKEIIPEELDEQIRLICDILYNKREEYPQQLVPPGNVGGLAKFNPGTSPYIINSGYAQTYDAVSFNLFGGMAWSALNVPTVTIQGAQSMREAGMVNIQSGTSTSTIYGHQQYVSANNIGFSCIHNPYFEYWIRKRSDTDPANYRCFFGLSTSGSFSPFSTAAGQGTVVAAGFLHDPTINNGNWVIRLRRRSNKASSVEVHTIVDTGISVPNDSLNTNYVLKIKFNRIAGDPGIDKDGQYNISWSIEQWYLDSTEAMQGYSLTQGLIVNEFMPDWDNTGAETEPGLGAVIQPVGTSTARAYQFHHVYWEQELGISNK